MCGGKNVLQKVSFSIAREAIKLFSSFIIYSHVDFMHCLYAVIYLFYWALNINLGVNMQS